MRVRACVGLLLVCVCCRVCMWLSLLIEFFWREVDSGVVGLKGPSTRPHRVSEDFGKRDHTTQERVC